MDEEQRFGVDVKERLKALRASVDVLTMTATPIPRTLHMSMLGIRDISNLTTPPANRIPVETKVARLTSTAAKRLRAIQEFSSMGAGFSLAMRELGIRGAGNLLGTQQSGHIATVGYELYCRS